MPIQNFNQSDALNYNSLRILSIHKCLTWNYVKVKQNKFVKKCYIVQITRDILIILHFINIMSYNFTSLVCLATTDDMILVW